jgi:hypothetical protein
MRRPSCACRPEQRYLPTQHVRTVALIELGFIDCVRFHQVFICLVTLAEMSVVTGRTDEGSSWARGHGGGLRARGNHLGEIQQRRRWFQARA